MCVCARAYLSRPSSFQDSLDEYPCGGEHTPNPIASTVPLKATPTIVRTTQLTAVTTATEAGHTIALLGDKKGELHKVDRWAPSWMQTPRIKPFFNDYLGCCLYIYNDHTKHTLEVSHKQRECKRLNFRHHVAACLSVCLSVPHTV